MSDDELPLTGPDLTHGVPSSALTEGVALLGHADGEPVLLTRCGGEARAVGARCPHYGAPLADGLLVDGTIRCPWHHAAFDLATGAVVRPPALEGLPCWRVEERGGRVMVKERRDDQRGATPPRSA